MQRSGLSATKNCNRRTATSSVGTVLDALAMHQAGALARGIRWTDPHVGVDERGRITLEWWHGEHALTLFIRSEERVDYLKSWGAHIESEMEDGELSRISDFVSLSRWLYEAVGEPA
jgi:hypothetical protein